MDIRNRVHIVTGSGTGIGRAIAAALAREGGLVVCCGRRKKLLDETVLLCRKNGGNAVSIEADITKPGDVTGIVESAVSSFGRIDLLFNNAGSFRAIGGIHEVDNNLWWSDVTTNLFGPFLMIKAVLPYMMKQNSGIIINMDGGRPPGGSAYAAGKAGLMELTKILLMELKLQNTPIIVVNAAPGLVRTEMTEAQAASEQGRKWIPSTRESFDKGNVRLPDEIASATVRFIRNASPLWNGKTFWPDTDFTNVK